MGKLKVNGDIEATGLIKSNATGIYRVNHFTTEEGVDSFQAVDTLQYSTISKDYTPIGNDGILISAGWSSGKYGAQIWIDDGGSSGGMKIRSFGANDGTKWNEWQTVLTNGNYNSYAPSLTGTGASGNWNISVKNLYYAQELSTAELLDGFNEALRFKAGYWINDLVPGCGNGIILNMGWTSATYGAQLAIDDDPTYFIALRQKNGSGWAEWKRIPMADGTGTSGTWSININGTSGASNYLNYTNTDEINFASSTNDKVYFNYRNYSNGQASGNTAIKSYYFCDRNGNSNATLYAGNYIGNWRGYSPSSFAEASHSHSYLPLSGGTLTGNLTMDSTKTIILRAAEAWRAGIGYDTQGNECIALWAKNTSTRLRWYAGTDMSTMTANTMMGITPDFEISKASGVATGYIGGNTILHSGNIASNGVVMKRDQGYTYTALSSCYTAGSTPTYYRITFPDVQVGMWNMVTMELTVRQSYDSGTGGKIIINAYHSSGDWTGFTAYVDGYMTHNIKVYGSGGKYFYISGCGAWSTLSLDKMIISDGAVTVDLTNTTCDYVASIPSGYSTATMSYGLTSTNYSSYAVPISGGTMTGKLQVNNLIFSYNYTNNSNAASFMLDKPGSHYTGIGANGSTSTIKFGPCNADGTWVSDFDQHWVFQGTIRPGCIILTNDQWTGYGSAHPNDAGLEKVEGRLYFQV